MTNSHVIPFGKHKGKPLEVLAGDPSYKEWLLGHGWFQERHPNLYALVINNYGEPAETPEHNQLQGKFLSDRFCLKFLDKYDPGWGKRELREAWARLGLADKLGPFESRKVSRKTVRREFEYSCLDQWRDVDVFLAARADVDIKTPVIDVGAFELGIEVKPSVGDDYPAILRQMRKSRAQCLLLRDYCGIGVTRQQFVEIFRSSGINVIFLEEVEPS